MTSSIRLPVRVERQVVKKAEVVTVVVNEGPADDRISRLLAGLAASADTVAQASDELALRAWDHLTTTGELPPMSKGVVLAFEVPTNYSPAQLAAAAGQNWTVGR